MTEAIRAGLLPVSIGTMSLMTEHSEEAFRDGFLIRRSAVTIENIFPRRHFFSAHARDRIVSRHVLVIFFGVRVAALLLLMGLVGITQVLK